MQEVNNLSQQKSWLSGIGEVVREGVDIYSQIAGLFSKTPNVTTSQPNQSTQPTLPVATASGPGMINWWFIAIGVILLVFALFISRK
jgi:hypothetical protein